MGKRRFRLSVQRKNHERKRWGFFPVRIPVKGGISVFRVSVPLLSLTSQQRDLLTNTPPGPTSNKSAPVIPSSSVTPILNSLLTTPGPTSTSETQSALVLPSSSATSVLSSEPTTPGPTSTSAAPVLPSSSTVSLLSPLPSSTPGQLITEDSASSLCCLWEQLICRNLPTGWFVAPKQSDLDDIVLCCLEDSTSIHFALRIQQGFTWTVSLRGVPLKRDACPLLQMFPDSLVSVTRVHCVLESLNACHVCEGNSEEKFLKFSKLRRGVFTDASGVNEVAREESTLSRKLTVRHTSCAILISPSSKSVPRYNIYEYT